MSNISYPIIIVGSGKATLLHLNAYMRIWDVQEPPRIFIVAGDFVEPEIKNIAKKNPSYVQFKDMQQVIELRKSETVIDICTPTATHGKIIDKMADAGFTRFIVEKPLVTTAGDLERISSRNIHVAIMHNYLFSKATERALGLIQANEFVPKSMASCFCKDRVRESVMKRGFNGDEPPHVFTIEIPHQLYLATEFLGLAKVEAAYAEDMRIDNSVFPSHGAGVIYLEHPASVLDELQNPFSVHYSCLSSDKPIKCVVISGSSGQTLTINYPVSKSALTSTVEIQDGMGNHCIEVFENDDMMKRALEHYYTSLTSDAPSFANSCHGSKDGAWMVIEALSKSNRLPPGVLSKTREHVTVQALASGGIPSMYIWYDCHGPIIYRRAIQMKTYTIDQFDELADKYGISHRPYRAELPESGKMPLQNVGD